MSQEILFRQHSTWETKPVLREIYADYFRRIVGACRNGLTLEVGGGSGNLKQLLPDVISTDLVPTSWVDAAADAQSLPFANKSFSNIVCLDTLHHIEKPSLFLSEASRILVDGGRLVLLEPAITPVSTVFYRYFHPEPVDMSHDPLADAPLDPDRKPFDANQGIPTLLFEKHFAHFQARYPELKLIKREKLSLIAYPLSGGFRRWSLVPATWVRPLLELEDRLAPLLAPIVAFRLMVVLEKHQGPVRLQ